MDSVSCPYCGSEFLEDPEGSDQFFTDCPYCEKEMEVFIEWSYSLSAAKVVE